MVDYVCRVSSVIQYKPTVVISMNVEEYVRQGWESGSVCVVMVGSGMWHGRGG